MVQPWVPAVLRTIAGGLNDSKNENVILANQSPDLVNVDLDRESVRVARGAIKWNNQTVPRAGVRTSVVRATTGLPVLPGKSAPLRGSVYLPYLESQDIGGDFAEDVSGAAPFNRWFHRRRGRDFEKRFAFTWPGDERLFDAPTNGQLYLADATSWQTLLGADLALDELSCLWQKGGDRLSPMSWAIGIVNTGRLFDIDVGGGLNIFGVSTAAYASRASNYALVFLWLDAPCSGAYRPVNMRYLLSNGKVWADEGAHVAASNGAYCTLGYRAFVAPVFVEPGHSYAVGMSLKLDTGTVGTGLEPTTAWNNDGEIRVSVVDGYGARQDFSYLRSNPGAATLLRYKGPTDSLEYFSKYGIRYSGRDALFGGLGMRFAPWSSAGFVPYGIDSAPLERGGFQITDHSVHGVAASAYGEFASPEQEPSAANAINQFYDLRLEYDPAFDPTGTIFGISQKGLVVLAAAPGCVWGNETGRWAGVGVQGKNPTAPYDVAWQGLGASTGGGFNPEALRSYRLVFLTDAAVGGISDNDTAGSMLSIGSYENVAGPSYAQRIIAEGGNQWPVAKPTLSSAGGNKFFVGLRCFRWNQREVVLGALRIYSSPVASGAHSTFALTHTPNLADTNEPGIGNLLACWPLDDAHGTSLRELVAGNDGYFVPYGFGRRDKGVFLSGEGEALAIDFSASPAIAAALRELQGGGASGFAIRLTMRETEAVYGLDRRIAEPLSGSGGASSLWQARFAPSLCAWDIADPARATDKNELGAPSDVAVIDHVAGHMQRPQPLLEFGHAIEVENAVSTEPFLHPLGFSLKLPVTFGGDFGFGKASVPGAGANGLHAWWRNGGVNASRWDKSASWVGRDVTIQIGVDATSTPGTFTAYIAAWPKSALNPAASDPSGAEFAYYASATIYISQLERSVVTIGGVWNPQREDAYDTTLSRWQSIGKSFCEANARVIVDKPQVYVTAAPGRLPASNGGVVSARTGRIVGDHVTPTGTLELDDLLRPLGRSVEAVNVAADLSTVTPAGGSFNTAAAVDSRDAIAGALLVLDGDRLELRTPNQVATYVQAFRTIQAVSASSLTLSAPVLGPTRLGVRARALRVLAHANLDESIDPLDLGISSARGYDLSTTQAGDATLTREVFANLAPAGMGWRLRIFSSLAAARLVDVWPQWARGPLRARNTPIDGLRSFGNRVFAAAAGGLFQADDRWRPTGPLSGLRTLAFHQDDDRVVFPSALLVDLRSSMLDDGGVARDVVLDSWAELDDTEGTQTLAWHGRLDTDPAKAVPAHGLQWWVRIVDGFPELVVGTTALSGGVAPAGGLFVARGATPIAPGSLQHVRWQLYLDSIGSSIVQLPVLWVGGKRTPVYSSHKDDATAGATDWIRLSTIIAGGASFSLVLGNARDSVRAPVTSQAFSAVTDASRAPAAPQRTAGWRGALRGRLGATRVLRAPVGAAGFSRTAHFEPKSTSYAAATLRFGALETTAVRGIGHRVLDTGASQWGVIYSHPFVSLTHEFGEGSSPTCFLPVGQQVLAANGGRVGAIRDGVFRFANLRAPASVPSFRVVRDPLWKPNRFVATGDPLNDPIEQNTLTAPATTAVVRHHNLPGSAYVFLANPALGWAVDKFLVFKAMFRVRSTSGRQSIFGHRKSLESGYFVELRDGYVYAGWWDTALKREVSVRTSDAVVEPGEIVYLYYRKFFPRGGITPNAGTVATPAGSNWSNSTHCGKTGVAALKESAYDMLVVRRVRTKDIVHEFNDRTGWDLESFVKDPGGQVNFDYWTTGSSPRACLSFTLADSKLGVANAFNPQKYSGTGYVIYDVSVDTTAVVNDRIRIAAGAVERFCLDHVGMMLQINGGTFDRQVYRIVEFTPIAGADGAREVRVVNRDGAGGASVGFSGGGLAGAKFSVFSGVSLVKSADYDAATSPDDAAYDLELFGSSLDANPLNGLTPFDGEVFGWAVDVVTNTGGKVDGAGNKVGQPDAFEDCSAEQGAQQQISTAMEVGTDVFGIRLAASAMTGGLPYNGTVLGELGVDATFALMAVDTAAYPNLTVGGGCVPAGPAAVSTQPNAALTIARDAAARFGTDPVFKKNNAVTTGKRTFRFTFYDPANVEESYVSPDLAINIANEDSNNPSGRVRIVFDGLPQTEEDRDVALRIYSTIVSGNDYFVVAQLARARTRTYVHTVDDTLAQEQIALDLATIGAPPKCSVLAYTQDRVIYARTSVAGNEALFSAPYNPTAVPPSNQFLVGSSEDAITAAIDYGGTLLVQTARSSHVVEFVDGEPIGRGLRGSDGCVSAQAVLALDDRVYFVSERGPMVVVPGNPLQGTQTGPLALNRRVLALFGEQVDVEWLPNLSLAMNRRRNQVVFTVKKRSHDRALARIGMEFEHSSSGTTESEQLVLGHRFSYYEEPALTSVATIRDRSGAQALVGGTEHGFLVWLDRDETVLAMLGPDAGAWGDPKLTFGAAAWTGAIDQTLEGPMGAVLRWWKADAEGELRALFAFGQVLFGETTAGAVVDTYASLAGTLAQGDIVGLGAQRVHWSTKAFDLEVPYADKKVAYLDVTREAVGGGTLYCEFYRDLSQTKEAIVKSLDLTKTYETIPVQDVVQDTRAIRLRLRARPPDALDFEITDLTLRPRVADVRP